MNVHQEIDRLLTLFEDSYSLTVPKSIDPDDEALTILSEINEEGRRDAKKAKHRDDDR